MKYKKILLLILLSFFIYGFSFSGMNPLKNLKSIGVMIEKLSKDAIEIGLTRKRLKTVVELRLRKEGIEIPEIFTCPYLYINISVVGNAFHVSLGLKDWVHLERGPSTDIWCLATTWQDGATGIHGHDSEYKKYIVSALSEILDTFFNDWYKANPKKQDDLGECGSQGLTWPP